jgi:hypothetical protein
MDGELLEAASKALSIEGVYLHWSNIRCKGDFIPQFIEDDLALVPQYRVNQTSEFKIVTAKERESGAIIRNTIFYFTAGVRLVDGASLDGADTPEEIPEDAVYIEINTAFRAHYSLDSTVDEDELHPALDEFSRYNVGYHVWPYWREYVQSVCARVGIPTVPIPMYKLPQRKSDGHPASENERVAPRMNEILKCSTKRKFADRYESADSKARELVDAFFDRVCAKYPDIWVYPTDKPDLRFNAGPRVAATLELKKRPPYLRLYLLKIPNAIPGTRLEFHPTAGPVLQSYIVIANKDDLDDAMRYMERSVENARQD